MRRSLTTLTMLSVTGLAAIGLAPSAGAATTAAPNCPTTYFCIFSGKDYTGWRCMWATPAIPDTIGCGFIRDRLNVASVANSTSNTKTIYTGKSYEGRIGSVKNGTAGNLAGNYQIRSFR
ncbi:peptidase inhibitor family I36 protein [Streptomyces huasconensis]|uniref:Peptidase inhibitor family I36 protein n=1 Tax=Streptomyces huasconensis TaxID=1854574 RepID=A0ABV3M635_9ACTN